MQTCLEGEPGQALGHIQASVPSAAFLTYAQCPAWPSPGFGLEDGPLAKRGRGAAFSLDPWLSSEHPLQPWDGKTTSMSALLQRTGTTLAGITQPLQTRAPPASSSLDPASVPALTDPEQETNRCYCAEPPPPLPEPFLEFPRHPKSSTHIPAFPERRAAAALLLNSKANRSLNSYNNKHRPIWAWAGRRRRHAQLVGRALIVKKKQPRFSSRSGEASPTCLQQNSAGRRTFSRRTPAGRPNPAPAGGRILGSQVKCVT